MRKGLIDPLFAARELASVCAATFTFEFAFVCEFPRELPGVG